MRKKKADKKKAQAKAQKRARAQEEAARVQREAAQAAEAHLQHERAITEARGTYRVVATEAASAGHKRSIRIASQKAITLLNQYECSWGEFIWFMSGREANLRCEENIRYHGFFARPSLVHEVLGLWVSSQNSRTGRETVHQWAVNYIERVVNGEATAVTAQGILRTSKSRKNLIAKFTSAFDFTGLCSSLMRSCPTMVNVLASFSTTTRQTRKGSPTSIAKKFSRLGESLLLLLGERSQQNNYAKHVLSLYLYASGAQRQIISVLSKIGLCSSYTALNGDTREDEDAPPRIPSCGRGVGLINRLAINQRTRIRKLARTYELGHVYDNYNIFYKAAEQIIGRKDTLENGTCATVFPLHNARKEDMRTADLLTSLDNAPPLSINDIVISQDERKLLNEYLLHSILRIIVLYGGPGFERFREVVLSNIPESSEKIPVHKTEVYPLPAMSIDESSTAGNADVLDTIYRELGHHLDSPFFTEFVRIVFGDQLSVARQRGVTGARIGHDNPQRTHINTVQAPGLFHYLMACASGTLETHFGDPHSGARDPASLSAHNILLDNKPIVTSSLPPYRVCRDLIFVSLYARILHCLELVADCDSLDAYSRSVTFEQLEDHARQILERFANPEQSRQSNETGGSAGDMIFENGVLFNRDALMLFIFKNVIREGDSGMIIIMLKFYALAYRTMNRPKYSLESLTQLHNILHVWPKPLRDIIIQNWVINPTGKANSFVPVDLMQEHFIYWIKKISPCIGILREIATQLNDTLGSRQGNKHQTPQLDNDIRELMKSLRMHRVYTIEKGRTIDGKKGQVPNVAADGVNPTYASLRAYNTSFERMRQRRRMKPLIGEPVVPRRGQTVVSPLNAANAPVHIHDNEGDSEDEDEEQEEDDNDDMGSSMSDSEEGVAPEPRGAIIDEAEEGCEPREERECESASDSDIGELMFSLESEEDVDLDM
ncbi:hypothetical protein K474DRAFT_1599581 [Panus rudis PR-1116 ss-1]|nr:hypothetical protein K474DRAFT_1599581 [Panus rudis PR-1116 ss-1]